MPEGRLKTQTAVDSAVSEKSRVTSDSRRRILKAGPILPLVVLFAASIVYASVVRRDDSIPTAVGANLVPAERVVKGEVPYRDFYKIQTPGILLINAGLFKLFGVGLLTAMVAVLVFKVLTVTMVFVC